MIKEFEFFNPFAESTLLFTAYVDLDHDAIAKWMRRKLNGHRDYTSYFNSEFNSMMANEMPMVGDLLRAIESAATLYAKTRWMDLKSFEGQRPDIWFSQYLKGDRHTIHNHPRAMIAGTYYPYADENSCEIRYRHPAHGLLEMAEPWMDRKPDDVTHTIFKLKPKTGMLNLWPSWMDHEIGPQGPVDADKSRLAISFNYGKM